MKTFLIHGNRDFLIGRRFCRETGIELLADGTVIDVYGRRVLLMHGDLLCIDDHAYQRLRRIVRNPLVQFVMRRLTLRQRQRLAERMREGSKEHIASMDIAAPQIMDVNEDEVRRTFARYGVDCIIHGHTHRPAVQLQIDGHKAVRIVLGDWYEQGSVLRWNERGFELATLSSDGEGPSGNGAAGPAWSQDQLRFARGARDGRANRGHLLAVPRAAIHRLMACFGRRQATIEPA